VGLAPVNVGTASLGKRKKKKKKKKKKKIFFNIPAAFTTKSGFTSSISLTKTMSEQPKTGQQQQQQQKKKNKKQKKKKKKRKKERKRRASEIPFKLSTFISVSASHTQFANATPG
jgi:hypothetical protein